MRRCSVALAMMLAIQWARPAEAASSKPQQVPWAFDTAGIVSMPLVTFGGLQLGHFIDTKMGEKGGFVGSTNTKLFFVLGTAAMYPALWGLGKATHVPVTWGSDAVGMGFGALTGIGLLGVDVGLTALFNLKPSGGASGMLALTTVVGWCVGTVLFIKADPFHLTRPPETGATMEASAPLLSIRF